MARYRTLIFFATLVIILVTAFFVIRFAKGYQFDFQGRSFQPTGLLVATSIPDGAQVWIDGKLKSATNTTINLSPGSYQVEIKKNGFSNWNKNLQVEKELVTKTDAWLFLSFPSLKPMTFTGATMPVLSPDGQLVAFIVPAIPSTGVAAGSGTPSALSSLANNNYGLWVLDLTDLPLGLSREPRQIIRGNPKGLDFTKASVSWSPDSKQLLVTVGTINFLIDTGKLNQASDLTDITVSLPTLKKQWQQEQSLRAKAQMSKLPEKLLAAIDKKVSNIEFSPDESKILYTATDSAAIPAGIIPPLPASSTQKETRNLQSGNIYVYDLKEDKNFFIAEKPKTQSENKNAKDKTVKSNSANFFSASWFPTSKHTFIVQNGKISIMEYDGANKTDVYSGPFEDNFAFPFPSGNRVLVLATIGKETPPNLYALGLQ